MLKWKPFGNGSTNKMILNSVGVFALFAIFLFIIGMIIMVISNSFGIYLMVAGMCIRGTIVALAVWFRETSLLTAIVSMGCIIYALQAIVQLRFVDQMEKASKSMDEMASQAGIGEAHSLINPVISFDTLRTIVWLNFYVFLAAGILLAIWSYFLYQKYWKPGLVEFKSET